MVTRADVRASYGTGRYVSGEEDFVFSTPGTPWKPALIFCHNRGATALSCFNDEGSRELFYDLAEYYTVCVADLGGGDTWGNGTARTRIDQIRTFLSNSYGVTGRCGLVGISMGGLAMLNWAKANPSIAAFACGIVPALNIRDIQGYQSSTDTNDGSTSGTYASVINTAYGGTYTDASNGADSSPYVYRASYPAATVKTAIWYSPADTVCRPQWATAMKTAQPSIELYQVRNTSGVGPAHVDAIAPSVRGNPSGAYYFPKPGDWCAERRRDSF